MAGKHGKSLVCVSVMVFKVLAWISLLIQVGVGIFLLVSGGPAVPIGGVDVPARVVGVLNCVAGGIYFYMLMLVSDVLRLLLDIRHALCKDTTSGGTCSSS